MNNFVRATLRNKSVWQGVIALLMLLLFAYFVKNQHLELRNIGQAMLNSNSELILLGLLFTVFFILLQAGMYVFSFKAVGSKIPLYSALTLYLKRNLISVFLPAGGLSSLAFFANDLKKHQTDSTQVYFASFLYGFCSLASVVVVGLPIIFYLLLQNDLNQATALGFLFLILIIATAFVVGWSVYRKRWLYTLLVNRMPKLVVLLEGITTTRVDMRHFIIVGIFSVLVEVVGIIHIYISFAALGAQPELQVATVAYVVMIILLLASPFLRGLGAIEVTMAYIFMKYGFDALLSASVTLLFRLFEFWIPLFGGILSFIFTRDNLFKRLFPPLLVFMVGMLNILNSVSPGLHDQLWKLDAFMPEILGNLSNNIILLTGILLCIVSYYLLIGSRNAWRMSVVLSVFSIIGTFTHELDIKEILFSFFTFGVLLFTRSNYRLRNHFVFRQRGIIVFGILSVSLALYTLLGLYFIDKRHFGHEFSFAQSIDALIQTMVWFTPPSELSTSAFGRFFVQSVYISQLLILVYLVYILLQPRNRRQPVREMVRNKAFQLAGRFGISSLDYYKLQPGQKLYVSRKVEGVLSFRNVQDYTVMLESPICRNSGDMSVMLNEFYDFCHENGRTLIVYKASDSVQELLSSRGMKSLMIGNKYTLNLKSLPADKPVLAAEGYTVTLHTPPHDLAFGDMLRRAQKPEILSRMLSTVANEEPVNELFAYISLSRDGQLFALASILPALGNKSASGLEVSFVRHLAADKATLAILQQWREYCQASGIEQAEYFSFEPQLFHSENQLSESIKKFDIQRIPALEPKTLDTTSISPYVVRQSPVYLMYEEDTNLFDIAGMLDEIVLR